MITVGILGGGQLGLLLAQAIARLGGATAVYDSDPDAPALRHTAGPFVASFDDLSALADFAAVSDIITYEFEHLPVEALKVLPKEKLRPSLQILATAQDRLTEKRFLKDNGFPLADFVEATSMDSSRLLDFGLPAMLKTVRGGYDGKGQVRLESEADISRQKERIGKLLNSGEPLVLERLIDLECEVSCIVGRDEKNEILLPVTRNTHVDSILDVSVYPCGLEPSVLRAVQEVTIGVARTLELQGILTVEFFIDRDRNRGIEGVLINELAPRPHNSGHLSVSAFSQSQYDMLARILLGLPLIESVPIYPGAFAMANIMGESYFVGEKLSELNCCHSEGLVDLVLYGKAQPRRGRKMGHLVAYGEDAESAERRARQARDAISAG